MIEENSSKDLCAVGRFRVDNILEDSLFNGHRTSIVLTSSDEPWLKNYSKRVSLGEPRMGEMPSRGHAIRRDDDREGVFSERECHTSLSTATELAPIPKGPRMDSRLGEVQIINNDVSETLKS